MIHQDFIAAPITKIIADAINALNINSGIGIIATKGFFEQSLFMQLMGFLEQKCKCIQWELATDDYEYRYKNFCHDKQKGYSTYEDKNTLYKQLIDKNGKKKVNYSLDRQKIFDETKNFIEAFWGDNVFSRLYARNYADYCAESEVIQNLLIKEMTDEHGKIIPALLINKSNMIGGKDDKYIDFDKKENPLYETIYKARNRIAHNTKCYQTTTFTFADINKNHIIDNFVVWLITLCFIDTIYIKLFKDAFKISV